jgi:CheY-like chemotaxis protein
MSPATEQALLKGPSPVVLVVDDEEDVRESLRDLLEFEGFSVDEAANGREAMERLDAHGDCVCLVLLDLVMPVMNGWEFVEQLRSGGRAAHVRVVIATSAPQHAPSGFPVLVKPMDPTRLLDLVKSYC